MMASKRTAMRIQHLGNVYALCSKRVNGAFMRPDLGLARYKRLGVRERFKGEKPYRICARCMKVVAALERGWR